MQTFSIEIFIPFVNCEIYHNEYFHVMLSDCSCLSSRSQVYIIVSSNVTAFIYNRSIDIYVGKLMWNIMNL